MTHKENQQSQQTIQENQQPAPQQAADTMQEAQGQSHEHHEHHEHHSHHSHHSHHKHRKSHKKLRISPRSLKKAYKKHKKLIDILAACGACLLAVAALLCAAELISWNMSQQISEQSGDRGTDGTVILYGSVFEEKQTLVNAATQKIMENQDMQTSTHVILEKYWEGGHRLDINLPVTLEFGLVNKPDSYILQEYVIRVSEKETPEQEREYTVPATQKTLHLWNLKTGTKYDYRVEAVFENGTVASFVSSFETERAPRVLSVNGIYNVRDIGGWQTADGKTVKQGLLYRGTEMDGAVEAGYVLTEEGRRIMLEDFRIRTDMDLRWSVENNENRNALGNEIQRTYYGAPMYTDIFLEENKETVRRIFSDLAVEESYPIYMHCTYGLDRTGTICCLLEALLGVSEEDIRRDYQLSGLHRKYLNDIPFNSLLIMLREQEGETLQENVHNYLVSVGVTEDEIQTILRIFLGE